MHPLLAASALSAPVLATPDNLTYDQYIATLNPTAYWKLDEASGLTAVDSIAARNGVYQGTILYQNSGLVVAGQNGVKFNDADDNGFNDVNIPANTLWNLSTGGSIVLWFRRNSDEFFNFLISQWDANDGVTNGWELDCRNTGGGGPSAVKFNTRDIPTSTVLTGSTAVNNDMRHMVGVTINALGQTVIYVDGEADASGTLTLPGVRTDSILTIGADWEPINSRMFMAKVALWNNTVVSPSAMASLYARGIV